MIKYSKISLSHIEDIQTNISHINSCNGEIKLSKEHLVQQLFLASIVFWHFVKKKESVLHFSSYTIVSFWSGPKILVRLFQVLTCCLGKILAKVCHASPNWKVTRCVCLMPGAKWLVAHLENLSNKWFRNMGIGE